MHITTIYGGLAKRVVLSASIFAFLAGGAVFGQQSPTPAATPACPIEVLPNRALDANLYMQTSAEYRAACYQAYNLASERLGRLVRREKAKRKQLKKLAVVMDLDETVFDNAGFQARLLRSEFSYCQQLWDEWEKDYADKIELIPGAKEFILKFKNNVSVVYISNRNNAFRNQTKGALMRLGLPELKSEKQLKLVLDPSAPDSTDKTARRQEAENEFKVLLYVGDNLRDFDEALRCSRIESNAPPEEVDRAIKARKDAVDKQKAIWGEKWIILPNPAYGEWTKPLGRGRSDYDRLVPSFPRK